MDNEELQQAKNALRQSGEDLQFFNARSKRAAEVRKDKARTFIVVSVVGIYVFSIALCLGYLAYRGSEDAFDSMSEMIKVAIVPILTLVIGYYFGSAKSE